MLVPGIVASKAGPPPIPPSAYDLFLADVDADAWYKLNENSGTDLFDQISQSNLGSNSQANTLNPRIITYTDDAGSLDTGVAEQISVANSIPDSWNPDGNTLETIFISFWVLVESLAAPITVLNSGDPTRFNIVINANGSVTLRYADIAVNTSSPGDVVAGERASISYWVEYQDFGFETFSSAAVRGNVNGNALSGSVGAAWSATRFPNLNLGGFTLGLFSGSIDELIIKYGNLAGGDPISAATGTIWCNTVPTLQPPEYEEEVLADTPVAYWKLNDPLLNAAEEISGFDGTYIGFDVKPVAALINEGSAVQWDGTGSEGIHIVAPALQILGDITMEAWVQANAFQSGNAAIMNCHYFPSAVEAEDQNWLWSLGITPTGLLRCFWEWTGGANQTVTSSHAISIGGVHHVVAVRDIAAKTVKFYDNGVLVDTVGYAENPTGGALSTVNIARANATDAEWDGVLDQVAVYTTKLSAARILAHYDAGVFNKV